MSLRSLSLSSLMTTLLLGALCNAQQPSEQRSFGPGEAQSFIREAQKLTGPQAIDELKAVKIGGIEQWISIRGRDRRNPILLFIHGGAGESEMPSSCHSAQQAPESLSFARARLASNSCKK